MIIAGFEATLHIHGAQSLKDKRMVIKSICDRLKKRFNVSVVESGDNDKWQKCRLGIAIAAISQSRADNMLEKIIEYLYEDDRIEIIGIEKHG